ncbi:uncharacterized protein LOC111122611 [Crassostrea virginica]
MLRLYCVIMLGLFYCYNTKAEIDETKLIHPIKTEESASDIHLDKINDKRASGFFRIGKSASRDDEMNEKQVKSTLNLDSKNDVENDYIPEGFRMVRVLNDEMGPPIYVPVEMMETDGNSKTADEGEKRASGFFRIGKSLENLDEKRHFFRIGKNDDQNAMDKKASGFFRIGRMPDDKRAKGFFRIGKSLNNMEDKRASGFFRIGKSDPSNKRASGFFRIGKSDPNNKRASGFFRIGKSDPNNKRASGFFRIGKSDPNNKRASGFFRIGKSKGFFRIGKSKGFFRIGKAVPLEGQKKASGFFRIGRNLPAEMRKKASGFFRIGRGLNSEEKNDKRASGFFRIGKSCSGYSKEVSELAQEENADAHNPETDDTSESVDEPTTKVKRSGRFFKIDKRNRISKRSSGVIFTPGEENNNPDKRAFFRIGKVPTSAFMRIGRQHLLQSLVSDPYYRNGRIQQSSFIRIGKRSVNDQEQSNFNL